MLADLVDSSPSVLGRLAASAHAEAFTPWDLGETYIVISLLAIVLACAALSPLVVARRWAFVSEGISHSGYGGAGTVWLLSLVWPDLHRLPIVAAGVALFSLGTAWAVAYFSRRGRVPSDAAVGVFLAATLAWGFVGREVYRSSTQSLPVLAEALLFGQARDVGAGEAWAAVLVALAIIAGLAMAGKEILAYCFDPILARVGGVRTGLVHYGLMLALAASVVSGVRLIGVVLVTALLVIPGLCGLLVCRRLHGVWIVGGLAALVAAGGGLAARHMTHTLPLGPTVVLTLFVEFLVCYGWSRLARRSGTAEM